MPVNVFQRIFDFGSKKDDSKNVSSSDAIKHLSDVEEMLNKKQQHLESQIDQEKITALRCSKQGNKRGALLALKRKKKFEKTLLQLDGTLTTLETQREYLQNASTNMDVLHVMRQAASALKKTNQNLDADQVQDLMDDLAEQHSVAEEIANAISSPIGSSDLYNDADLERELELLAQEEIKDDMMKIGPLPDVPIHTTTTTTTTTTVKTNNQSEELRQLEAWAQ
ncbi:unnamed protein product [Rotaria socialis]|uniref:Uncharacterized protein n=1 Tax=Rotaria socialis TaxID=392032 RepID=A0A817Y234_9BILA|nr:unnamed protein product [Rotaria socialis]CAF4547969.1 unnamed protein product [Rotaria socialis]